MEQHWRTCKSTADTVIVKENGKARATTSKSPLPEQQARRALLAVKPTTEMPRPGASPTGKKKTAKSSRKSQRAHG